MPRDIQKMFNQVLNQVKNKFKVTQQLTSPENYTLYVFYFMIENKVIQNKCIDLGFKNGELVNYTRFQQYLNIDYTCNDVLDSQQSVAKNDSPLEQINLQSKAFVPNVGTQLPSDSMSGKVQNQQSQGNQLVDHYMDQKMEVEADLEITPFGMKLLAHTNYTLIKFF